jgi:hypothetical protein
MPVLKNSDVLTHNNSSSTKIGTKDVNGKFDNKINSDSIMDTTNHHHTLLSSSSLSLMDCSSSNLTINLTTTRKNTTKRNIKHDKNQSVKKSKSKCPHVVLIGNILEDDFEIEKQIADRKRTAQSNHAKHIKSLKVNGYVLEQDEESTDNKIQNETDSGINDVDSNGKTSDDITMNEELESLNEELDELKCDECSKTHNLWLCLRENCMHVGCGQDDHSNKHGSLHAFKTFHPLSMNLKTRNVWCELCETRIDLENNNPPVRSDTEGNEASNSTCEVAVDDLDLLTYLEQDCSTKCKLLFIVFFLVKT